MTRLGRREALVSLGAGGALLLASEPAQASSAPGSATLAAAVEAFRVALLTGNAAALEQLLAPELLYMHSSGFAQPRDRMIAQSASGYFAGLAHVESQFLVAGDTGVAALTVDQVKNLGGGRTRASRIKVMQTWHWTSGRWRMLARLSAMLPVPGAPTAAGNGQ
ncbi:MAG: nuclear transport factor 2 family protein [Sphingomonadales bacterium]|nr:nuclear transport factor 2 family protein [Sphingomonadales bacterium]